MKKAFIYILLSSHIFFSGNIWIVLENYFSIATAATTTLSYAGTATDLWDSTQSWITPINAVGDITLTSANMDIADRDINTNTLSLTNFDLAAAWLPSWVTINGIQVEVEWEVESNRVQDSRVQLTKDGTTWIWNNYANISAGPTTKAFTTYGWLTDLWGTTWTAADLLSSNFWVHLQYVNTRNRDRIVDVYRVRITVDYSVPNSIPTDISLSSNTINEGLPIGTNIWTLTTTDADIWDSHTYSLECSIPGTDDASFTISTNNLNSNEIYNFDTKSSYSICIRTNDGNWGVFDKNFTILINDITLPSPGWVDTNLALWLKADKGTSTTTDWAWLATWSDQSWNNMDATAVDAPIYRNNTNNQLNYNPVIDFNGTSDYMRNLTNGAHSDSYYLVIVPDVDIEWTSSQWVPFSFDCESWTLSTWWPCGLPFGGIALWAFTLTIPDEVITHAIGSSANYRSSKTAVITYPAWKPLLIGVNDNSASGITNIYEKWEQIDNATRNTYQTLEDADYWLWRSMDDANPFYYDGKIAEVINYNWGLSTLERQKIESYLAIKYGITLNSWTQDYISSDGNITFWSTSTNTWYNNDIFWIGRDDNQELWHIESKSINDWAIVTIQAVWEGTNLSNSFVDISNNEFFMSWDNAWWNTWTAIDAPASFNILSKQWKAQENGDVGDVNFRFDVDDTDFDVPALSLWTNYFFVFDSDGDGNLSDEIPTSMTNTTGSIWESIDTNVQNWQIYTIATLASANSIPTDIILSNNTINENVISGTTLGILSTTDSDVADTHTYTLVWGAGDDDNNRFTISGSDLNFNHSPDHEIQESYSVRIETSDGNWWTFQKMFSITINDLGEAITSTIDFEDSEDDDKYTLWSGQWNNNTVNPNSGSNALESDNLGLNNTQSCFQVEHNSATDGFIEFDYNVSSQAGSDELVFLIDNVQQDQWSGTIPYTTYTSWVQSAGPHTYKWCYIKDGAGSAGTDNAYIDNIIFTNGASDITAPNITTTNFASWALLPWGNHNMSVSYADGESWINTASSIVQLYKWDWVSSYGPNIAGTWITVTSTTSTTTSFSTNNLDFWKYQYRFSISDNAGNPVVYIHDFYIDEPELTVSTGSIDTGTLSPLSNTFSDTVTVTVRTVGAAFDLTMDRSSPLTQGIEEIPSFSGSLWYGYQQTPYDGTIQAINTSENIASETENINTNGLKNTYTYEIQIGALIDIQQAAGEYMGGLDFNISLTY